MARKENASYEGNGQRTPIRLEALQKEVESLKKQIENFFSYNPYQQLVEQKRVKTIEVAGASDHYYPVSIVLEPKMLEPECPARFSIGKKLGSKTAAYDGNHENGTSSCAYHYIMRTGGWDGNGRFLRTLFGWYGYAPLLSHIEMQGGVFPGVVVWLRGGGTTYNFLCDYPFSATVYYDTVNLGSGTYVYNVAPRTDIGNAGLLSYGESTIAGIWG